MQFDLSCPVELRGLTISKDTETVEAVIFNLSPKTITAIEYTLILFDEAGEETGRVPATIEGITLAPRETYTAVISSQGASSANLIFTQFSFDGEDVFTPTGEMTDVEIEELDDEAKARLLRAGVPDGVCYSKEENGYWLCVCGRPNINAAEICVRCEREKNAVLENYSSEQSVAAAIIKKEDADAAFLAEQERIRAEQRVAKKKAILKNVRITVLAIIAAVILAAILLFGFKFVVSKIGDFSASKGNYTRAFSMYQLSGSKKFDDVAGKVYGNTSTNLMQMGILAQDDENVYYLDTVLNIFKQNKETGEKTALSGASGKYLNASGGWLYYINAKEGNKVYRISPDGATNEAVSDMPAFYLFTSGNDVYFISQGADNKNDEKASADPSAEPEATPANDSATGKYPLYVVKNGSSAPQQISNKDIAAFTIYKGKIYYIDFSDNYSLYSMSLKGKGSKKIIEGPVYSLEVVDNKIYYTDGTVPEGSQGDMPKLTLETATLDGKHLETVIDNAMVTVFSKTGDTLYYTDYNNQGKLYKRVSSEEPTVEAESVYIVNVSGDVVYYLAYTGEMYLTKPDKSGYEMVSSMSGVSGDGNTNEAPQQ